MATWLAGGTKNESMAQMGGHTPEAVRLLELGEREKAVDCLRATVKAAPQLYGRALRTLVGAARGRFWIRPSAAAEFLMPGKNAGPTQPGISIGSNESEPL